jgi:hypothetical protein
MKYWVGETFRYCDKVQASLRSGSEADLLDKVWR